MKKIAEAWSSLSLIKRIIIGLVHRRFAWRLWP